MSSKKRRIIAIFLCLLTVVSLMAACGKGDENEDTAATEGTSGGELEDDTQDSGEETGDKDPFGKYEPGITLRGAYFVSGGTQFIPGNPDYDSPEQNLFIQAYKDRLGIDVVYDWVSADVEAYDTKWNMAMAQKDLPDFGLVNAPQYKMLLEAGLVMDMTDVFEEYASDKYKEFLAADGGATLGYSTQDGRMMGLPITGAQPDSIAILHIRKDWLDELGMEVPTTIDELTEAAKAFKENGMGGADTYGIIASKEAFEYDLGLRGFMNGYGAYPGAWVKDEAGNIAYGSTLENIKEPLLKLQELYKEGLINKDFAVTDYTIAKEDVASGKVGIAYGTYYLATGTADAAQNEQEAEWAIVELPTIDGSPAIAQSSVKRSQFIFVNKDCKNPEAVVKLVNLEMDLIYNDDPEVVKKHTTHAVGEGDDAQQIQASKYVATVYFSGIPWQNKIIHEDIMRARETGNKDWTISISETKFEVCEQFEEGDITQWNQYHIFGPNGTFSVISKMWDDDRIILDEYQTLPTQTMTEKEEILDDALKTAMIKVIMGEDISVYEKAVDDWFKNGGQIMTDEVNDWYANK